MKRLPTKKPTIRPRVQAALAVFWVCVGSVWIASGGAQIFEAWLDRPLAFHARELFGKTPPLSSKLKVFAFDDRTFASVGKPYMDSEAWARIVENLVKSKPSTIVFNYMFGAGELTGNFSRRFDSSLDRASESGIRIVGASIPYPGKAKFKVPLPLEHPEFSLPSVFEDVRPPYIDKRGYSLYGPPAASASLFQGFGHTIYNPRGTIPAALVLSPDRAVTHLALTTIGALGFTKNDVFVRNQPLPIDRHGDLSIDFVSPSQYAAQVKSLSVLQTGTSSWIQPGDIVLILTNFYTGGSSFAGTPFGTMPIGWITMASLDTAIRSAWIVTWGTSPGWLLAAILGGWFVSRLRSPSLFWTALTGSVLVIVLSSVLLFSLTPHLFIWSATVPTLIGFAIHLWSRNMQLQIQTSHHERIQHEREAARLSAVVRTTQMFAHDVRKPFRLVQMARDAFRSTVDPQALRSKIETLLPELEAAVGTVETMVQDLMHFEGQIKLQRRERYIEDLLVTALQQVCRGRPHLRVNFSYRFDHRLQVEVDESKLLRVITNLIDNAIDASGQDGHIWFHIEDVKEGETAHVLLCIGNAGSIIPKAIQSQIFEAFYTSGKKEGTGLGLAIAKQIVTAHGGAIWCESDDAKGTEFYLTLPIAQSTPYTPLEPEGLPSTSEGFQTTWLEPAPTKRSPPVYGGKPILVVVDDSLFTLETWQAIATDAKVYTFLSPSSFWESVAKDPQFLDRISIIVTDYYFDRAADNGIIFAKELRKKSAVPIFLSTDGMFDEIPAEITGRIGKEPISFARLQNHLPLAG